MARFTIPQRDADTPTRSGGGPFPEGVWDGVVDETRIRVIAKGDAADFLLRAPERGVPSERQAFFAEIAEIGSLQLGSNVGVLVGQPEVGEQKMFDDNYYLSIDGVNWDEPDITRLTHTFARTKLEQTRRRLTNLASRLGYVDRVGDQIGPVDEFDSMLRNSGLQDAKVRYRVAHTRPQKRADGTTPDPRAYVVQYDSPMPF